MVSEFDGGEEHRLGTEMKWPVVSTCGKVTLERVGRTESLRPWAPIRFALGRLSCWSWHGKIIIGRGRYQFLKPWQQAWGLCSSNHLGPNKIRRASVFSKHFCLAPILERERALGPLPALQPCGK